MADLFEDGLPDDLLALLEAPSVSGAEGPLAEVIAALFEEAGADRVERQINGNVVAFKGEAPKKALVAHLDTVGWAVQSIGDERCPLVAVGGVDPAALQRARLDTSGGESIEGLVLTGAQKGSACFEPIDPGALSRVRVGDRVRYAPEYVLDGSRLAGPYLDDRLGLWLLVDALRGDHDVVVAATVAEETTGQGAYQVRRALEGVDEVLIVDVTYGSAFEYDYPIDLGKGPVLGILDDYVPTQLALDRVEAAAGRVGVTMQREVVDGGGTDAVAFVRWDRPVLWAFLGIPSRNNHRAVEVVDLGDLAGMRAVMHAWLEPEGGAGPGRTAKKPKKKASARKKAATKGGSASRRRAKTTRSTSTKARTRRRNP